MRAAAVSALANFGAACEPLRPRIIVLLRRALSDNDDEVRAGCMEQPWRGSCSCWGLGAAACQSVWGRRRRALRRGIVEMLAWPTALLHRGWVWVAGA